MVKIVDALSRYECKKCGLPPLIAIFDSTPRSLPSFPPLVLHLVPRVHCFHGSLALCPIREVQIFLET